MDIQTKISSQYLNLISTEMVLRYRAIPFEIDSNTLSVYSDNIEELELLEILTGYKINPVKVSKEEFQSIFSQSYRVSDQASNSKFNFDEDFVNQLISNAKSIRSSDIHIETYKEKARIRFRVDGQLIERFVLDKAEYPALVNKIKVKANLDIAEKRLPQDGRISIKTQSSIIDLRVSILPTMEGEKIVIRILGNDANSLDLNYLGFSNHQLQLFLNAIQQPNGIVLISGPTGSGKTTTLYAGLKRLNEETRNILTVEDPIEYTLPGINQVQVKEPIGLTFAAALRSFLRQDPDIIMLGEIRDAETAQMAVRASLTGHLVLSTIHTNSALGTVNRLIDMGIPAYLLADTINLSIAQRLVKKLCNKCKAKSELKIQIKPNNKSINCYEPVGCNHCFSTGFHGRIAIYELIPFTLEIKQKLRNNTLNQNDLAKLPNYSSLSMAATELYLEGITSYEEIVPFLLHEL